MSSENQIQQHTSKIPASQKAEARESQVLTQSEQISKTISQDNILWGREGMGM